jgi:pimeloyl-ACP methyl ester carboxylesterase
MQLYLDTPDQYIVVNGARLHYLDWGGAGRPLLFLPGIGEPASVFKWFAPRFLPRYRPVALTRRGTGKSQVVPGTYQLSQLADDARAVVDALHLAPVYAVGHSYGGFEITHMAAQFPDRVRGLVYLDALYGQESLALIAEDPVPGPQPPALPSSALRSFHDYFSYIRASYPFTDKEWSLPTEEAWAVDLEIGQDGQLREIDRGTVLSDMMATAAEQPLAFTAIRCPVLAIAAFEEHHPNTPPDADIELRAKADQYQQRRQLAKHAALNALKQQRPDAQVIEIANAPHHLYLTHGDIVFSHMIAFLDSLGEERSA